MMQSIIPLWSAFLTGFSQYLFTFLALAFLATVPCIIRFIFRGCV